jgi:hypothetical protein
VNRKAACCALALTGLLAGASPTGGSLKPAEAKINFMKGEVTVARSNTEARKPAYIAMPLYTGDRIASQDKAEAEIALHDGSILKMKDKSEMVLTELSAQKAPEATVVAVKVYTGKVLGCIKKMSEPQSRFHLESPTAVASVRGTVFAVFVEGDTTELDVLRGRVAVSGQQGPEVLVGEKMGTVVTGGDSARSPFPLAAAKAAFIAAWAGAALKIGSAGAAGVAAWYASTPALIGGATAVAAGVVTAIIIANQKDEPAPPEPAPKIPGPPGWPQ